MSRPSPESHATANATPADDHAEFKAWQTGMIRELAELSMNLARAAAHRAAQDLAEPPEPSEPASKPASRLPSKPRTDHALTFTRLARAVREAIAVENRIRSDDAPPRPAAPRPAAPRPVPPRRAPPPADRRRPLLRRALHQAAEAEPDRAARNRLRRDIDERIEHELGADLTHDVPIHVILIALLDHFELSLDPSKLSDELLGIPPTHYPPDDRHPDDPRPDQKLNL